MRNLATFIVSNGLELLMQVSFLHTLSFLLPLISLCQSRAQLRGIAIEVQPTYDSIATVGEIRVYWRADFQSGSRVLKKVF